MIDEDSAGFVEAFTAAVRPGEARGRPGRWMLLVGFAVAFTVALGALLNGAFSKSGSGSGSTSTSGVTLPLGLATLPLGAAGVGGASASATATATASPGATKAGTWTAVAGPGCTNAATGFTETGYYDGTADAAADWATWKTGGYVGDGCGGGFVSVPLSGRVDAYDSNRYVVWTFDLGSGTKSESCQLATYVPAMTSIAAVGGDPAHYYYYGAAYTSASTATPLGDYAVTQVSNLGKWVPGNAFTVATGRVSVRLVDAGVNQTSTTTGARAAAAQVRLTCSPA